MVATGHPDASAGLGGAEPCRLPANRQGKSQICVFVTRRLEAAQPMPGTEPREPGGPRGRVSLGGVTEPPPTRASPRHAVSEDPLGRGRSGEGEGSSGGWMLGTVGCCPGKRLSREAGHPPARTPVTLRGCTTRCPCPSSGGADRDDPHPGGRGQPRGPRAEPGRVTVAPPQPWARGAGAPTHAGAAVSQPAQKSR